MRDTVVVEEVVQEELIVTLSTDKTEYDDGDNFTLFASVESTVSVNVDVYVWAETPDGTKYFLSGSLLFGDPNEVLTFVTSWQSFDVAQAPLYQVVISGLPSGTYTFHAILVEAGAEWTDLSKQKAHSDVSFEIR